MSIDKKSISFVLDAETRQKLEIAAARKGVSVEQYCAEAVSKELDCEPPAPKFSVEGLIASGEAIMQGRRSYTDSADLIREAREERHRDMEGHGSS